MHCNGATPRVEPWMTLSSERGSCLGSRAPISILRRSRTAIQRCLRSCGLGFTFLVRSFRPRFFHSPLHALLYLPLSTFCSRPVHPVLCMPALSLVLRARTFYTCQYGTTSWRAAAPA